MFTSNSQENDIDFQETCNTKKCEPSSSGNEVCQNYGYCSPRRKECCLGHYVNCTFPGSRPVRPQKNCFNDEECGSSYCDQSLKICCTEGDSSDAYCPGGTTFFSVEPSCQKNLTCPENSTCVQGSCCPSHSISGLNIIPFYYPYTKNRKCQDFEAPPLWNMFCRRDTHRWTIVGEYKMNGVKNLATGEYCRNNEDCSPNTVCIRVSDSVGLCYVDPMATSLSTESLDFYWLTFYISLPTACLLCGCMVLIYRKKQNHYYN